jgi:hypothetical protein
LHSDVRNIEEVIGHGTITGGTNFPPEDEAALVE